MKIDIVPPNFQTKFQALIKNEVNDFFQSQSIKADVSLGINFVTPQKMKTLNKKYRQIDQTTDVLSFPIWPNLDIIPKRGKVNLGEIVISTKETNDQENLKKLIRHSLNHLVGKHH